MSASSAISGFSTTLQAGDSSSPAEYLAIAELVRISGIGIARETFEATHLTSDQGWKEFKYAMQMATDFTCELNFIVLDDSQETLLADVVDTTANAFKSWRLMLPDYGATTATFTASGTTFTISSHGFNTGQALRFTGATTLYSGLTAGRTYWIKRATANTFSVHVNPQDAYAAANAVNAGSGASGTQTAHIPSKWDFTAACTNFTLGDVDANAKLPGSLAFKITGAVTTPA